MDNNQAKQRLSVLLANLQGERSLRQFAIDLGVGLGTIQNWISGSALPSPKNLQKIAEAAGMRIDQLYDEMNGQTIAGDQPKTPEEILLLALNLSNQDRKQLIRLILDSLVTVD